MPRFDRIIALAGGMVAPDNGIDRPPRPWANGIADRTYRDCMARQGWRVARG